MTTRNIARPLVALGETWIGVNFWSRAGGPFMWRDFEDDVVREELRTMSDHDLTVTRSFFFWPDFHPEPYRIDEEKCAAFARFLDLHLEEGLVTIPTFIVGHMSGQNWDPAWRAGRSLYSDVWMLGRQAWFITEMVRRFRHHPAVTGWLISNEMPLYGGGGGLMGPAEPVDGDAVRTWGELMISAVRAGGGAQPVSLGDGAWGAEVMGADNGFALGWTAPLIDWIGPHSYHMSDDPLRQNLIPAFNSELCGLFGRPVVLEEFGVTGSFASDANAAHYYRQVLHSTLAAGVTGWLAWNNTDFDLPAQEPYDHRPFELHFGLTTSAGVPKPALEELGAFARSVSAIRFDGATRPASGVGLVVSGYFGGGYPFWPEQESATLRAGLLESYLAARLADLSPALVRDAHDLPAAPLLVVPSAKAITTPGCRALEAAAAAGSTVWVTHAVGEALDQRGWWWPDADATFGIRVRSRYGLVEPVSGAQVLLRFEEDFGDIPAGTELRFPVAGADPARARLLVDPDGARAIARDENGDPAIVIREVGEGRMILCTLPLEFFVARTPFVDHRPLAALYRALAIVAGCAPELATDDLDTFVDRVIGGDGTEHAIVLNTVAEPRDVRLLRPDGSAEVVALGPLGATVLHADPATVPPVTSLAEARAV